MKKRWYDYLWIASLTYLVLGFFNILFAWLGLLCFFIPLVISVAAGSKGYCNRYCGRGQLFSLLGGRFGLSRKKGYPQVDEEQMVPLWLPGLFLHHVLPDALEYISGFCRSAGPAAGGYAAVDLQGPLAVGVSWDLVPSRCGTVRLWILQRYADIHGPWPYHHGPLQAPQLVRVLSDGHADAADLQGQKRKSVTSSQKPGQKTAIL